MLTSGINPYNKKLSTITLIDIKTPVAILIIRIALSLILASLAVFISVDLLLWSAIPGLTELMTRLGLVTLLSAFSLLLITGLFVLIKLIMAACFDYFSARQRLQRKLLFIHTQQDRFKRLFYFRKLQINYFNNLEKKQLLNANDRQHLQSLSKAIYNDLQAIKHQLPKPTYRLLQREHSQYRDQQDIEALLRLQQKITTII